MSKNQAIPFNGEIDKTVLSKEFYARIDVIRKKYGDFVCGISTSNTIDGDVSLLNGDNIPIEAFALVYQALSEAVNLAKK